ncbi:alpha-L-fucosidase-like [Tribolium madens]|uniref:alpha-L-fucosidase-like n=1 Tax=Tribolium madens TaxID=41895 RepID=UPI001CF752A1|nr:alpha-L-fucosidase-like [Tribolium madens]
MFFNVLLILYGIQIASSVKYEPTWESLDDRPLPEWYDKAKVGIFLHWGVYSVPSFGGEWFWNHWERGDNDTVEFIKKNYPPDWTYQDFAPLFTAEFYDPFMWVNLFLKSGAKYIVLTSKHHEGYTLWPSKYSFSWNANDVGPHRDLLGDLAKRVKARGLHFGVYHSLFEWYHPLYLQDKTNNWNTSDFVDLKIIPEMKELITTYEPEVLWSDGEWEAPDTYWKSKDFLAWLYNESPVKDVIVTNDRWGSNTMCTHGGFYTCSDRYNPGFLLPRKWENAMTVDGPSWGYRRNAMISDILTPSELITTLVETVSCGGNILINVGPTKEGTISPIFQQRLMQLGTWLSINGDAIYDSSPWTAQNDTSPAPIWYTAKNETVYAIVLEWPTKNVVTLQHPDIINFFTQTKPSVTLLGNDETLLSDPSDTQVTVTLPDKATVASEWGWVLKMVPTNTI